MYVCDFCEEKTDLIVGFVNVVPPCVTELKLCFSCYEQNVEKKILKQIQTFPGVSNSVNDNIHCMYCDAICWSIGFNGRVGNTPKCAIEVVYLWVQYRICKKCWKEQR